MSVIPEETIQKWKTLIDRVIYYTSDGKLIWQPSGDEDAFVTRVANSQISMHSVRNAVNPDAMDYIVNIYNKDGEVVDSFMDEDLGHEYFHKMKNLFSGIIRRTSGSDEVLDKILKELSDPHELPF